MWSGKPPESLAQELSWVLAHKANTTPYDKSHELIDCEEPTVNNEPIDYEEQGISVPTPH